MMLVGVGWWREARAEHPTAVGLVAVKLAGVMAAVEDVDCRAWLYGLAARCGGWMVVNAPVGWPLMGHLTEGA